MKKLLAYIAIILGALSLLTSCMTVGRIERNCGKFQKICSTDTKIWTVYHDTTIYRHDTVYFKLPPDTVKLRDTVTITNNLAYMQKRHQEFGLIGVDAWINRSVLKVNAYLNDSTILQERQDTIFIPGAIKEKTIKQTIPVKYIPAFYKFTFYIFWIALVAALAFIYLKFRQPINKFVLSKLPKKEEV